ncbi:hypothetical protein RIF29_08694 [Crotalaria pallida]|uniref:Uncharacterized protein n=1 Tax=Crotalaria pallida TaxID=3830 RepID=A0AAN9FTX4_CROPI
MSDIALLIAEEYERRAKIIQKASTGVVRDGEFNMVSSASLFALTLRLKERVLMEKRDLVKWICEPKSQIAIAASNSFFSA